MFQRDYLLREIERLAEVLSQIRRQLLAGEVEDSRHDVDALADEVGLNLLLATTLDPESLLAMLGGGSTPAPEKLLAAAQVLYADALVAAGHGSRERETKCRARALVLLNELLGGSQPVPEDLRGLASKLVDQIEGDP